MSRVPFTEAETERLKALWADEGLLIPQISKLLNRPGSSLRSKARGLGLPDKPASYLVASKTRTDKNCALVERLYGAGLSLDTIGRQIGVSRNSVRRMVVALGIKPRAMPAQPFSAVTTTGPRPPPAPARLKFDFRSAPIRFDPTPRDQPAIGDRILSELNKRPLSTMSLSSVIGEKEAIVGQALSALRYEGRVVSEGGLNIRQTVWSVAA